MFKNQIELFLHVWGHSPHYCSICNKRITCGPRSYCFAHILGKGMYPQYKLFPNNISLVCSVHCHKELDRIVSGSKFDIEEQIIQGFTINIKKYGGKNYYQRKSSEQEEL